jgi:hypothetical protein
MSWHNGHWYGGSTKRGDHTAASGPIHLRAIPVGYPKSYRALLSQHTSVENALHWAALTGTGNRGRVWIEAKGQSATVGTLASEYWRAQHA